MTDGGLAAVLNQIKVAGATLSALRTTIERAAVQSQEARGAVMPLQFRMEGTGRRVLRTVDSVDRSLEEILGLIDGGIDDLLELEENLTS